MVISSNSQAFVQFLGISLKTMNMVLLQSAEIADKCVFSYTVQSSIKPFEVLHAEGMLLLSVPGVLRKSTADNEYRERSGRTMISKWIPWSGPEQKPVGLYMPGPTICLLG